MAIVPTEIARTCWVVARQFSFLAACAITSVAGVIYIVEWLGWSRGAALLPAVGEVASGQSATEAATTAIKWSDAVTLILTATTVILAALAIILAVAAVVGYAQIRMAAESAAKSTADRVARETAAEVAGKVAADVAGPVAARTAKAYMQRDTGDQDPAEEFRAAATNEGGVT